MPNKITVSAPAGTAEAAALPTPLLTQFYDEAIDIVDSNGDFLFSIDLEGLTIETREIKKQQAERIVQHVNIHDELVAELRTQIKMEYNPLEPDNQSVNYKRMTELLAKATGSTS